MPFRDRGEAGRRLAGLLTDLRGPGTVVLGLPRGGVAVAAEIARALQAPLDVILVRKVGLPAQPELAMGAIGEDGIRLLNLDVVRAEHVTDAEFAAVEQRERVELDRRARRYREALPRVPLAGRTAIVVDDGIATGSTARVACRVARAHGAARVVLAVPVAPRISIEALADAADEVVCLESPEPFFAIGQWYQDFTQCTDADVIALLAVPAPGGGPPDPPDRRVAPGAAGPPEEGREVVVAGPVSLAGHLTVPAGARGIVVFAHGSGSSRNSPRNLFVAGALHVVGLGTLLFDLLTPEEEADRSNVFDIALLAGRLAAATGWLRAQPGLGGLGVGYFGASTGAAAALVAAADPASDVAAVVSRGGRPDLAGPVLAKVRAPTLLIVGGLDDRVLALNAEARAHLPAESELAVVPGASHLFAEPGALEQVASLARVWFARHLGAGATVAG
jgi:putative phosphoribosyl transferase